MLNGVALWRCRCREGNHDAIVQKMREIFMVIDTDLLNTDPTTR